MLRGFKAGVGFKLKMPALPATELAGFIICSIGEIPPSLRGRGGLDLSS